MNHMVFISPKVDELQGEGNHFMKKYKELNVDFEIPWRIQQDIEQMMDYLNNGGEYPDVYIDNLKSDINSYDIDLTPDQQEVLRNYYCRGGLYG